jgi:TolB-like protein/Flp pilus assembly protein TadD
MNGSSSAPRTKVASPQPEDGRLDSWKEIAAYLRRDESTVRRWEKDGLPVHRHRHRFRAAVFAYKSELDTWWNNSSDDVRQMPADRSQQTASAGITDGRESQSTAPVQSAAPAGTVAAPLAVSTPVHARPWSRLGWLLARPARRAVGLLALVVLVAGSYWAWQSLTRVASPPKTIMLAVLPLENLSGNPDEEYFSDGLTEEMITQLSRLQPERLGIIARTSTMQYKGTKKRVDEIGRELHVDYVLEGSVRRDADQVRISAQLIRVSDQTHVWAENYQRDVRDILAVQSLVAGEVAREISVQLTAKERAKLASARPVSPRAHELYLRGRYLWNKRTEQGLQKSVEYFQQAIAEDPGYAASYAALADAYNVSGNWGLLPPREAYPRAKAAATKALEIDPRLAEARVALAYATHLFDWNPAEAEKEFKQALDINPNYAPGRQWYAVHLAAMGRFDEAIAQITRAQELDPLSLIISDVVGWIYSLARRHERAIQEFRKAIELDPNFYPAHYDLGMTYADKGMHEGAIKELETARALSGDTARTLSGLAYAYAMAGQKAKAKKLLGDLNKLSRHRYVPPFDIAVVHAALGDKDLAFAWLEKAYEDRHPWLVMLRVTPKVDNLRSDPRFEQLCLRVGLSP